MQSYGNRSIAKTRFPNSETLPKQVRESFLTTAQLRKYALFWQQALTSD
jgi:hypothetical protein